MQLPLLVVVLLLLQTTPEPLDERIAETIRSHTHALALADGRVDGPGADMLLRDGAAASFFCIGESHLNNETAALTSALLAALRPHGYSAFALEIGSTIAEHIEDTIGDDPDAVASLFAEMPFTAPFVDHVPEFELVREAVESGYDFWGLDQIFVGGARFNLARLVTLAPNNEARKTAEAQLAAAQDGVRRALETGDQSQAFLFSATASDYESLRRDFAGVEDALRIIDELEYSGAIYRLFYQGANYESNHERINLMKRHLAEHVRTLSPGDRVVMKFGTVHMGRGYSPLHQLDLGNAAAELGVLRGGGSLHVYVTAGGLHFPDGTFNDFTADAPELRLLLEAMGDAAWIVTDLRPLRPILHREENAVGRERLADLVWRYDVAVVTREFTRADPLPGVPPPPDQ